MHIRLDDKTAVITGAGRGIGWAIASEMHAAGAHVIIADIDPEAAQQAVAGLGERALALHVDAADVPSC
jgi:NAD(P)-dependent dehydrogenase (short-subunit alcohol dehydrogenase family)